MTERKEIAVSIEKRDLPLIIKTPEGNARVKFARVSERDRMKWDIDSKKDGQKAEEIAKQYTEIPLGKLLSVEGLFDDGKEVTIDQIRSRDVSIEIFNAVVALFWLFIGENKAETVTEEEAKKGSGESASPDSSAQTSSSTPA